jgi:hypothetical protein
MSKNPGYAGVMANQLGYIHAAWETVCGPEMSSDGEQHYDEEVPLLSVSTYQITQDCYQTELFFLPIPGMPVVNGYPAYVPSGGGSPPLPPGWTVPPIPYIPPREPLDTNCRSTVENMSGLGSVTPLTDNSLQQTLFNFAVQADAGPTEQGGVIVQHSNGTFDFIPRKADAASSPCNYYPLQGYPYDHASGDSVIAYVHTHPDPSHTVVCPELSSGTRTVFSGPSQGDYDAHTAINILGFAQTSYIVDPHTIFRLDGANVTPAQYARPANATQCAHT